MLLWQHTHTCLLTGIYDNELSEAVIEMKLETHIVRIVLFFNLFSIIIKTWFTYTMFETHFEDSICPPLSSLLHLRRVPGGISLSSTPQLTSSWTHKDTSSIFSQEWTLSPSDVRPLLPGLLRCNFWFLVYVYCVGEVAKLYNLQWLCIKDSYWFPTLLPSFVRDNWGGDVCSRVLQGPYCGSARTSSGQRVATTTHSRASSRQRKDKRETVLCSVCH